jgi:hypothetical protein
MILSLWAGHFGLTGREDRQRTISTRRLLALLGELPGNLPGVQVWRCDILCMPHGHYMALELRRGLWVLCLVGPHQRGAGRRSWAWDVRGVSPFDMCWFDKSLSREHVAAAVREAGRL